MAGSKVESKQHNLPPPMQPFSWEQNQTKTNSSTLELNKEEIIREPDTDKLYIHVPC